MTSTSPLRRHRKTRIIATLGPSSSTREMIERLFRAGADVFRLNMSHGDHAGKEALVRIIRDIEQDTGCPLTIMADLQGPKIRVGEFDGGPYKLMEGDCFRLDSDPAPGDARRVHLPHSEILTVLEPGMRVLINDGKIRLQVDKADDNFVDCVVKVGGEISDRKGVNVPDVVLPLSAMTEKDRRDLDFVLGLEVDWIALSFVQRAADVQDAKAVVKGRAGVLAKIEKPAALLQLNEILDAADAVMVARGDLGVEAPIEEVPVLQRDIILAAREKGKPVVVATQMLESMITAPTPTRAEVSDVATAVFDDADAVMLSAESAAGQFPVEAVTVMDRVAQEAEASPHHRWRERRAEMVRNKTAEDAITQAARVVARTVHASAIICYTTSGSTALRAARERPSVPILALTPQIETARRLGIVWGLHAVKTRDVDNFEEMVAKGARIALRQELAKGGDRVVMTAGVPFGTPGATNVLHIHWMTGHELDDYDGTEG